MDTKFQLIWAIPRNVFLDCMMRLRFTLWESYKLSFKIKLIILYASENFSAEQQN